MSNIITPRKELLQMLIEVLNQACHSKIIDGEYYIHHFCISTYEDAFELLISEGLLERNETDNYYKILWDKLEEKE